MPSRSFDTVALSGMAKDDVTVIAVITGYVRQQARSRMPGRANPFDWSGGDPALDFVNTLDERPSGAPVENLATYGELVRFAALAGLIDVSASRRLRRLKGPNCSRIA